MTYLTLKKCFCKKEWGYKGKSYLRYCYICQRFLVLWDEMQILFQGQKNLRNQKYILRSSSWISAELIVTVERNLKSKETPGEKIWQDLVTDGNRWWWWHTMETLSILSGPKNYDDIKRDAMVRKEMQCND